MHPSIKAHLGPQRGDQSKYPLHSRDHEQRELQSHYKHGLHLLYPPYPHQLLYLKSTLRKTHSPYLHLRDHPPRNNLKNPTTKPPNQSPSLSPVLKLSKPNLNSRKHKKSKRKRKEKNVGDEMNSSPPKKNQNARKRSPLKYHRPTRAFPRK